MNLMDVSKPSAPAITPLPWRWFDFHARAERATTMQPLRESAEEAAQHTWYIECDGMTVPFKFFRQPSDTPRPALLLMHGMGLTIATFRGVAAYLLPTHDLILPDYSGFTLNTPLPAEASFKGVSSAMWKIADTLGIEKFSLGGNSLGGGFCLQTTVDQPSRIEKLVLSNPACFPQGLPSMYRLVRFPIVGETFMTIMPADRFVGGVEYIGYVDRTRFDPALRQKYLEHLGKRRTRFRLMQFIRSLPQNASDLTRAPHIPHLKKITQPVLLSWGTQDKLLVPGSGERLAAALPNVTFETYEDLAHMPHEERPDLIGPRWAEFLRQGA